MKQVHFFFVIILLALQALSLAQTKPLLSDAIRKAIDEKGIELAKKEFAEQYRSQKDFYEVDMKGISELSRKYSEAGNIQAAGVVMEIATPYMQDLITSQMNNQNNEAGQKLVEMQQNEKEKQLKEKETQKDTQKNESYFDQGKARTDLERFTGLYADPEEKNENRKLWVMISCDGYLVIGALWGDASPWWMKSEGDNIFSYKDSFTKLNINFETDSDGKAVKLNHDLSGMKSPLKRVGPLPDDWEPCLERPKR